LFFAHVDPTRLLHTEQIG